MQNPKPESAVQAQCIQTKTNITNIIIYIRTNRTNDTTKHIIHVQRQRQQTSVIPKAGYRTTEVQNHRKMLDLSELGLF